MPKRFLIAWTGFALLVSVEISGCSLIGFGVGSAIDATRGTRLRKGDRYQVFQLEPGSKLRIQLADGTTVAGTYRGLAAQADSNYARRYAAWCDTAALSFRPPRIGEMIRIESSGGRSFSSRAPEGVFLGFGPKRVHYLPRGSRSATYEPMSHLRRILTKTSPSISRAAIDQLGDRLPVQSIAIVRQGPSEHRIDLLDERIVGLEWGEAHHGFRTAGLVIGLTADATVILLAAALSSSSSSTSCQPTYTGGGYYMRLSPVPAGGAADSIYFLSRGSLALND